MLSQPVLPAHQSDVITNVSDINDNGQPMEFRITCPDEDDFQRNDWLIFEAWKVGLQ